MCYFFLRSLQIKKKHNTIHLIKDERGQSVTNLDLMAEAMLNFLSQIIGKGKEISEEVLAAREGILASVKSRVSISAAIVLEGPFSIEECK